jgi:cAMP phosphodiesterase
VRVKVLGAGGGEDVSNRLSSFLIDEKLLLDAGAVTRALSLKEQEKIKAVFLTHAHLDHIRDLPFLLDNFVSKKGHTIEVFALKEVLDVLRKHIFNQIVWPDFTQIPTPSAPLLKLKPIEPEKWVTWEEYQIYPFEANHGVPAVGYLVVRGEKRLFYSGDTGPGSSFWGKLPETDAIITEVSFPDELEDLARLSGHYTPKTLIADLASLKKTPKCLYFFHLKPTFKELIIKELKGLFSRQNPFETVKVLSDGEIFTL